MSDHEKSDDKREDLQLSVSKSKHCFKEEGSACGRRARRWVRIALRHLGLDKRPLRAAAVWGPALGLALAHVGDSNFFALLPLHLSQVGLVKDEITKAIAAANIGDAAGRLALIVAGFWLGCHNRLIFAVGGMGTTVCVLGISWLTSWNAILTFSALLGMCRGLLYVTIFLGIAEVVVPALFPAAMALLFAFIVISSVTLSPLIGVVRDVTRSYPAGFCCAAALTALFPVGWGVHELVRWFRRRGRHHQSLRTANIDYTATTVDFGEKA